MEDKIPLDPHIEDRDQAATEAGKTKPADSSPNAESGAASAPGTEPEALLPDDSGSVSSPVEREASQETIGPPTPTPPVPQPVEWKGLDVMLFLVFSTIWLIKSFWRDFGSDVANTDTVGSLIIFVS